MGNQFITGHHARSHSHSSLHLRGKISVANSSTSMFFGSERKPKNPEEIHVDAGRTQNSMHAVTKAQDWSKNSNDFYTFLVNGLNCSPHLSQQKYQSLFHLLLTWAFKVQFTTVLFHELTFSLNLESVSDEFSEQGGPNWANTAKHVSAPEPWSHRLPRVIT